MWTIALEAQEEKVTNNSVAFLVNSYLSVEASLDDRRVEMLQSINNRCFELLKSAQQDPLKIKRIIQILEMVIKISEKKGTSGVQPHNAILKGEMLDRIIVRYMVKSTIGYLGSTKLERTIVVKLYTSATVWEFKKEVSGMLGLAPHYMSLKLPKGQKVLAVQNGMTLSELGLKNGDILTATKLENTEDKVVPTILVDYTNKCLIPKAVEIFTEWYEMYKDPMTGLMGKVEVAKFIRCATGAPCGALDDRVSQIIKAYDDDKDGNVDLNGFLKFYYVACTNNNLGAVHQNLLQHNVRLDLKKMSEVTEECSFEKTDMPRYTLSANQAQFSALFDLVDSSNSEVAKLIWDLVRSLATNQKTYQEVLDLSKAQEGDELNWKQVFEDQSVYRQIYKQEIIVALMESGSDEDNKRVMYVED